MEISKYLLGQVDSAPLVLPEHNNVFLIDWITFVAHGDSVDYLKWLLGLDSPSIPWETSEKFRNGYPVQTYWNGITISYGADNEKFYSDPRKARHDMGVCVNLSGTGCRAFETYGHGDWFRLFSYLCRDISSDVVYDLYDKTSGHKPHKSYNITRLDLAYDDHIGLLSMAQLEQDTRQRNYVSRAKYAEIVWSDDQNEDLQGMTVQVGSDKSDVKIRIYDKAAERGFKDRHWIRCELQLRRDRAFEAVRQLLETRHIGKCASGILRNYLTYRIESTDSNKSRWPIAEYWDKVILDMDKISLWVSPGEEYNFSKTVHWLVKQYGQAIVALDLLHNDDPFYLIDRCKSLFPKRDLAPKYLNMLNEINPFIKWDVIADPDAEAIFEGEQDMMEGFQ